MSEIVIWEPLARGIADLTTIAEFVADEITAHESDNDAHNASGGSLYLHRTTNPADHADGSINTQQIAPLAVTAAKIEAQEAWIAPTLLNSWVNYGTTTNPAGYMKDSLGFVHLRGFIKSGTIGLTIFTLPEGYRPAYIVIYPTASADAFARGQIEVNGGVKSINGSNVWYSLDGIIFKAEA